MLHAHLAFIYRNVDVEQLNQRVVFSLLASQIFLFNYFKYDVDLELDPKDGVQKRSIGKGIAIFCLVLTVVRLCIT